jgi:acid phosphatase family membrane protein YuiD|tara:strand:+ start:990 stop:1436 length:447 start_codon:yes stop_codon:yes gene_type:complete
MHDALHNVSIWSAFWAWFGAQLTKMVLSFRRTRRIDFRYMVSTGGMPSAHSSLAAGLATSVGLQAGFGSAVFAVGVVFATIVMFDAQTVRRAAGHQAHLLNQIVDELFEHHHLSEQKLAEFLGHTRLEVFMGLLMGIFIALLTHGVIG